MLLYITAADVPANFIDADKRIQGIQIEDHEIKRVNFADYATIFLRDITCFNSDLRTIWKSKDKIAQW